MKQRLNYAMDPERMYISGMSSGGKTASRAVEYLDTRGDK